MQVGSYPLANGRQFQPEADTRIWPPLLRKTSHESVGFFYFEQVANSFASEVKNKKTIGPKG